MEERAPAITLQALPSLVRVGDHTSPNESDKYPSPRPSEVPPSPTSSSDTPVYVNATPRSDSPPSSSMSDSWVAVTPSSDDDQSHSHHRLVTPIMTPDLALAVEGLRIHEHEESFPSEGEDEEEDISASVSDDSSLEDDANDDVAESSDEETILAPRTMASLSHPISDEALRASLSTLLKSKETSAVLVDEFRRTTAQGPLGMESLSLVNPEEFATRASVTSSRASSSSKSHSSRLGGKKSHSKRTSRSPSKSRNKDNGAQVYALWTAAITAGFLVGFGAGYAWKEYLTGGGSEDVRRVGCTWCGDGKR